jgi:hypothetical protein
MHHSSNGTPPDVAVAAVRAAAVTAGRPFRSWKQRMVVRSNPAGQPWWRDSKPGRELGWRQLTVLLGDEVLLEVDYRVCRRCRLGWVDHPPPIPHTSGSD